MSQSDNKYVILANVDPDLLADDIARYLSKGWNCTGNLQTTTVEGQTQYMQAIERIFHLTFHS